MRGMTALALLALAGACGSDEGRTSGATGGTGGGGQAGIGGAAGSGGGAGGTGATASGGTSAGDAGGAGGFATLPWEGGPAYYSKWKNGPPADPSFFPIAVWLQSPSKAAEYQAIGVNTYIGLWQGPTEVQLSGLGTAKMPVLCAQEGVWASHLANPTIQGWTHDDEPDNAQPDGNGGYGPCVEPSAIVALYQTFTKNDPSRPVYLNFGPGAANTDWIGRGVCTGKVEMYPEYVKGADIVSFDIYPVNETDPKVHGKLEYVAKGVELLRKAVNNQKPVWVWLETTDYNGTGNQPSPEQIRSEAWMALIHGARGVGYFAHVFKPSFIEAGLLANATTKAAVQKLNQEITALAPVLNTPSLADVVAVESQDPSVPIDVMVKESGGSLYVFAIAAAGGTTTAKLTVKAPVGAKAEVIGESRSVDVSAGSFSDAFSSYAVHLYQLPLP